MKINPFLKCVKEEFLETKDGPFVRYSVYSITKDQELFVTMRNFPDMEKNEHNMKIKYPALKALRKAMKNKGISVSDLAKT